MARPKREVRSRVHRGARQGEPNKDELGEHELGEHELGEDELAELRRDQPRSSVLDIQKSFANTTSTVNFNWINPGPVNLHLQNGGVSGKLQAFAWEPSHPQVMYAGGGIGSGNEGPTTEAGVFKSIDGGKAWNPANQGLLDTTVNVLWVDSSHPSVLLAGTEFGGLFRTSDGAATWTPVLSDASVSAIVSVSGGIIAGTAVGIELSSDDGLTWTILQRTVSGVRCMAVNGTDIIAGLDGGDILWKGSSDSTWRTVASNPNLTIWDIAIDPVNPTVAYYARGYGGKSNAVFRTMDHGISWENINAPTSTNGGFSQALAVRASDRAIVVAGQGMLYQSLDFGSTWERLNGPWDSRKIFLLPTSSSMVIGSDQGLHWSDDGGHTWRDLTSTISANILFSVAVSGQTILTSSQDFGPFLSADGGHTWTSPSGPLAESGAVAINPADPTHCYAMTNANLAVSTDSCQTFATVAGPTKNNYVGAANQNVIAVDPHSPSHVYVGEADGVWSSSDWGVTFTLSSWPVTQVTEVVFDPITPGVIYVCSTGGLFQSINGGATWNKLSLPTSSWPYAATVSPTNSNVILVALADGAGREQGGVLRSIDGGFTFTFANQGLSTATFNLGIDQQSIAFNPASPPGTAPVVALATTGGVYASGDLGRTWLNIGGNATPHTFSYVHWDSGYLWVSTYGQGVLRSGQTVTAALFASPLEVGGGPISLTYIQGLSPISGSQPLQITTPGVVGSFSVAINQGSGACGTWLSATPLTGTTSYAASIPITVSYDLSGVPTNANAICDGTVTVTGDGVTVTIPVAIQITPLSDTRSQQWNLAFTQSTLGLSNMNMVFDSNRKVIVMFGGRDNLDVYSTTYQYTPSGWNRISTSNSPPARYWSAMAYDNHRERIVLFGGQNNSTKFGDTWEFDGANWIPVLTVDSPTAQSGMSMTYDACRQKTILFDSLGRTWEYDGVTWANVTTPASPPARSLSAMIFDPVHCRALLFGGQPGTGPLNGLSDTWSYDGTNWTQVNTPTAPPGRWGHAMAFDTSRGRIVLFGGYGPAYPAGGDTNDTWEFDGTTWVQVLPQSTPPSTGRASIAYDESRDRMAMFGGLGGQDWEYTAGPVWAVTTRHAGTFSQGQSGATYTVTVSNVWNSPTSGVTTLAETIPLGLSLVSMSGAGWSCASGASICTRTDPLAPNASYPPVTVIVNVSADAPPWATNFVTVSGAGMMTAAATDLTPIAAAHIRPQILSGGIVNAATYQQGGIAPNEFISLIGTGLGPANGVASEMTTELAGTSVSIGGTPAYLIYAQDGQINALVPFNVSGLQNTTIQVQYDGMAGNTVTVPVVPSSPGIFTQQYGPGQVWMVNQDGTFNSSSTPAARNTYVTFWVTGQGAVNAPLPDGTQPSGPPFPTPILPVSISIGGVTVPAADMAFDGLVYSGEVQINLLIPAEAPTGSAIPLVVTIGAASSRSDATIAIK